MWIRLALLEYINLDTGARVIGKQDGTVKLSWATHSFDLSSAVGTRLMEWFNSNARYDCRDPKETIR